MQASVLTTRFSVAELESIRTRGVEVESSDYGQCRCGQLRLIVGGRLHPGGFYNLYSHGELLFRVDAEADLLTRYAAVAKFLQEIGCAPSSE